MLTAVKEKKLIVEENDYTVTEKKCIEDKRIKLDIGGRFLPGTHCLNNLPSVNPYACHASCYGPNGLKSGSIGSPCDRYQCLFSITGKDLELVLPHRGMSLLIDSLSYDEATPDKIQAIKMLDCNDPFVQGHFPGEPAYPGMCLDECINLAGAALITLKFGEKVKGKKPIVRRKDGVKYSSLAIPDPLITAASNFLHVDVSLLQARNNTNFTFSGKVSRLGEVITSIDKITAVAY